MNIQVSNKIALQSEVVVILVTGGAGFIGSNFVIDWIGGTGEAVVNLDKLTYAGNLRNLAQLQGDRRHHFVHGDICERELVTKLLKAHRPRAIVHFAAETHVDRSIVAPETFIRTNVNGTLALLEAAKTYWSGLTGQDKDSFRFLHVSTDEVYGSLKPTDPPFSEATSYAPNSPYSASKAAADHLVRSYHRTYGLPTLITVTCNNYGPYQFPEKLIPLMIVSALAGKPLPIYGDGEQIRDWLYVNDHCSGIRAVLLKGRSGETYNIGGSSEKANISLTTTICEMLDEMSPRADGNSYKHQIIHVADRPGHDRRYAIDARKIENELGWRAAETFDTGIRKTICWYLENDEWVQNVMTGEYQNWIETNYAERVA